MIHVYAAPPQPATNFVDIDGRRRWFSPDIQVAAECCRRYRLARDCVVQCYYDGLRIYCADGYGCKSAEEINAKEELKFRHRSAGQKRRWEKQKVFADVMNALADVEIGELA